MSHRLLLPLPWRGYTLHTVSFNSLSLCGLSLCLSLFSLTMSLKFCRTVSWRVRPRPRGWLGKWNEVSALAFAVSHTHITTLVLIVRHLTPLGSLRVSLFDFLLLSSLYVSSSVDITCLYFSVGFSSQFPFLCSNLSLCFSSDLVADFLSTRHFVSLLSDFSTLYLSSDFSA